MNTKRPTHVMVLTLAMAACSLAGGETLPAPQDPSGSPGTAPGGAEPTTSTTSPRVDPRRSGLELGFGEFAITLEAEEIRPGPVTFVIRNGGALVHGFEIEIEETGDHGGSGHSGGGDDRFKVEGPAFGPGESIRIPLVLAPGVYEIECFVAEHDDMGMRATLVVRRGARFVRVDPTATSPDRVGIGDFAFSPSPISVERGAEVTWRNDDPTAHTVTARDGSFDSGTIDTGTEFATAFERTGTFQYFCQIHPTMQGAVRVVDPT
jgi:plastocyanin